MVHWITNRSGTAPSRAKLGSKGCYWANGQSCTVPLEARSPRSWYSCPCCCPWLPWRRGKPPIGLAAPTAAWRAASTAAGVAAGCRNPRRRWDRHWQRRDVPPDAARPRRRDNPARTCSGRQSCRSRSMWSQPARCRCAKRGATRPSGWLLRCGNGRRLLLSSNRPGSSGRSEIQLNLNLVSRSSCHRREARQ